MLYKCKIKVANIKFNDMEFEGCIAIHDKTHELFIYVEYSEDDVDCQELIRYFRFHCDEKPTLFVDAETFCISCYDCYLACITLQNFSTANPEIKSRYYTINASMIRIGCLAWIDYPMEEFKEHLVFDEFILDEGSIGIRNLEKWNSVDNDCYYDYVFLNDERCRIRLKSVSGLLTQHTYGIQERTQDIICEFDNTGRLRLPELLNLLCSFRDFMAFITGRYIWLREISEYFDFPDGTHYTLRIHVNWQDYSDSIESDVPWSQNNVSLAELDSIGAETLFRNWDSLYQKNAAPLRIFNRQSLKEMPPEQAMASIIIALDGLTKIMDKQGSEIHLKERIKEAIFIYGKKFSYEGVAFDDDMVSDFLKNLRVAFAHGRDFKKMEQKRFHRFHYDALRDYALNLYIAYIRKAVLRISDDIPIQK